MKIFGYETSYQKRKDKFVKDIQVKLQNYFTSNFQRLDKNDFIQGAGPHNHRCFYNSVQHAADNNLSVHLVFCIENLNEQEIFLHVINKNTEGKYQDNTLGYFFTNHEYYYIKECLPDSYKCVWIWFEDLRKKFLKGINAESKMIKFDLKSSDIF